MANPTVTPITELRHSAGFLVGEVNDGMFSREQITLLTGNGVQTAGLVLGKVSVGAAAFAALGTNTGNPTCGAITVVQPAIAGEYDVVMEDATHFIVLAPAVSVGGASAGDEVGHGVLGTAFAAGGIGFTLTAGGTPCVAGDSFKVTVAAGSGKYKPFDPTANDGSEVASAILLSGYKDTTSADQRAAALTGGPCKVNAAELLWGANVTTTPQQTAALAQLKLLGIKSV
jgi:hypothetical protein